MENLPDTITDEISRKDKAFNQESLSERLAYCGLLPMFGFPTESRQLYLQSPKGSYSRSMVNAIDRDLTIALGEFAPGKELVKDKKLYKAVGFIAYKNGIGQQVDGLNELKDLHASYCPECGFLHVSEDDTQKSCPICGGGLQTCKTLCAPLGYCVDYSRFPEDFDGRYDWEPQEMIVGLDFNKTKINLAGITDDLNILVGNNKIPEEGVIHRINTNNMEHFSVEKSKENGWVVKDLCSKALNTLPGTKKEVDLIGTIVTGILEIGIKHENPDICLDLLELHGGKRSQIKQAYLSWGEMVRKAVCDYMDIDLSELSVGFTMNKPEGGKAEPIIYLMENLQNGAGYTDYLGAANHMSDVFKGFLGPKSKLIINLTSPEHVDNCDSSCYDCLRDYSNLLIHKMLNWRLGLDLNRIAMDEHFVPSLLDEYWKPLCIKAFKGLQMARGGNVSWKEATDTFVITENEGPTHFLAHPLWSDHKIETVRSQAHLPQGSTPISVLDFAFTYTEKPEGHLV